MAHTDVSDEDGQQPLLPAVGALRSASAEAAPVSPWQLRESLDVEVPVAAQADQHADYSSGRARAALYGSHFLSAWGARTWEFAVGLILLPLNNGSLALVSAYGLTVCGAQIVLGAVVGRYIDRAPRLTAACSMYMLQNAAVAASAACALLAFHLPAGTPLMWAAVVATIGLGATSRVGALGSTLSVEREWTKTLCQGDTRALAWLNAGMRRIDLTCLIAAPMMAGALMTFVSLQVAVLAIVAWNLAAWAPEVLLLTYAQRRAPQLRQAKQARSPAEAAGGGGKRSLVAARAAAVGQGWRVYAQQRTLGAGVALALLYLTVMSFDLLMTAYLNWRGMSEAELSLYRGAGALAGLSATLAFPPLQSRAGLRACGTAGIWCQFACLAAAAAPAVLHKLGARVPDALFAHVLVGGLVASRFGLWLFDLAVNQMLQQEVPHGQLGVVNGVQSSLQSACQSASFVAGLLVWRPQEFEWLMLGSVAVVACAALLYTAFAWRAGRSYSALDQEKQCVGGAPRPGADALS